MEPSDVIQKGRLQPGKMFLVDTREGRIVTDGEIKDKAASAQPYGEWLERNLLHINDLPPPPFVHEIKHETVLQRQRAFGYTEEDVRMLLTPMATNAEEA